MEIKNPLGHHNKMDIKKIIITGVFGSFGAILRYSIYKLISIFIDVPSFYSTMIVNIIGCFFLSYFVHKPLKSSARNNFLSKLTNYKNEILSGLIGAFTTFSTIIYDLSLLNHSGDYINSVVYLFCSIFFALLAVFFGELLACYSNTNLSGGNKQIVPLLEIGDAD